MHNRFKQTWGFLPKTPGSIVVIFGCLIDYQNRFRLQ